MNEPGRKLFIYDSMCRDPVDWAAIKRHKRNHCLGAKVTMKVTTMGMESGDTLAVLKNIYQTFRTERPSDHLSEDIMAALVPGVSVDTPVNETLTAAWKSMRGLGHKHQGPKIGSIRVAHDDVLSHYSRGTWNPVPQHHLLFTYQANPSDSSNGRKRMRYLKDNARQGDTFFSEWPVPMHQLLQMTKITTAEHDAIFALDTAMDDGAEDGAGAAMVHDLGDKVVPFPREFHVKLWQEMIHVWGIEAAVLFQAGSGQALLAFIIERKRAVAIVKNAKHKAFVTKNLVQAVKSLGLAPDRRPPKPADLVAWESSRALGGTPPPAATASPNVMGATPTAPTTKATLAAPPPVTGTSSGAAPAAIGVPGAIVVASGAVPPALAAFGRSTLR